MDPWSLVPGPWSLVPGAWVPDSRAYVRAYLLTYWPTYLGDLLSVHPPMMQVDSWITAKDLEMMREMREINEYTHLLHVAHMRNHTHACASEHACMHAYVHACS